MKKQVKWILTMTMILALAGLACNAFSGGSEETPAATKSAPVQSTSPEETTGQSGESSAAGETTPAEPTAAPSTGDSGGGLADLLNLDASNNFGAPTEVNSYRISFDMTFEGTDANGGPVNGRITAEGAQVRDPAAYTFTFGAEGDGETAGTLFTFMQVGGTTYMIMPQAGCMSSQASGEENPFTALTASGGMVGEVEGARRVGEEEVNGVQTTVYEFDDQALNMLEATYGVWSQVEGRVYVAQDGGYVVRVVIDAQGNAGLLAGGADTGEGTIHYELNYYDFNQPIEIVAPEECLTTAADQYPTLDDAFESSTMGGLVFYKTNHTFDEVVEFYKTEMAAAGWTLGEEMTFAPAAFLTFSKEGETVQVSIAADQSSGATTVTIMAGTP
ncbi:MAG: hypothetical protein AB1791_21845 [Chloroflexota bacterium]